ncbi:hypothetical protein [Glycomyces harbinensis]|uniref:Uncharacterized protein n=1 Tax=Glycomyces harbinensis TaxID=58114 RepID=A0A1G7DW47_9ACTN|nr:hypothetical protein [Glycomyces harbinensis]SDE55727.1 hypothetical protein SAMN05216270_12935 [Glycomyces harbinensis]
MTYPPQSPEPHQYPGAPGPGVPGPQPNPSGDFATEWGIKEHPGRPKKINQLTQLMWAFAAATVLNLVFAIIASATAPWWYGTGFFTGAAVFGLILGAAAVAIAWFVIKDKLGAFGANDPRLPLYITLGVLGFFSLGGFASGWSIGWYAALSALLALAKLGAVVAAFYLLLQPETEHWLKSRPGNQPKPPVPPQHPGGGYPQQPGGPQQQQQPPGGGYQQPPAAGQQIPPGYPNEM